MESKGVQQAMSEKHGGGNRSSSLRPGESSTAAKIAYLPLVQKIMTVRGLPPKERMECILSDPEAEKIVRALEPQEMYWLVKEIGVNDALDLLELCKPEQIGFFLDMECWEKYEFSASHFLEWLGYLLEGGERKIAELLTHLDMELLTLCLMKTVTVGGGLGDTTAQEESESEWDHTFDNCYYINFKEAGHSALLGRFIEIIYRENHPLYLALMESLKAETPGEVEELSYRFRTSRLGDLGFPAYEDAISIYARLDPEKFTPSEERKLSLGHEAEKASFQVSFSGESLLKRALNASPSEELLLELNCLINNAIIAEGAPPSDGEAVQGVMERVYGYLTIALEHLCGESSDSASKILEREHLKKLFQLGRGIILKLRDTAKTLSPEDIDFTYATNKALIGLKAEHPRFYRGLDPDLVDGYREFREINDVKTMETFLKSLIG